MDKAVARTSKVQDGKGLPAYTYTKVTLTEELDATGKIKDRKEKIYRVCFQNGLTRARLVQVNGHAPADGDVKAQADNDGSVRHLTGQSKNGKSDNRENFLTPELVGHFDFELLGQTNMNGRTAFQMAFKPKNPDAPVHHLVDRLLNRISGTLWIDAEEFELARAEVELHSEVNLLGGVVGSLKKLAYTLTRTRVADGLWLNSSSSGDFEGRKLIDPMRIKTRSLASNFRPLS